MTTYRIANAGMLSKAHVEELPLRRRGTLYSQFFEHVFIRIPEGEANVKSVQISVDLPPEWAPDELAGQVLVFTKDSQQHEPTLSLALSKTIYSNGDGHYSLRVDYPEPKTRYYLAWKVRETVRY